MSGEILLLSVIGGQIFNQHLMSNLPIFLNNIKKSYLAPATMPGYGFWVIT